MTQRRVRNRSKNIEEILIAKDLWALSAHDFNPREEFVIILNSNQNPNLYVYKILQIILKFENVLSVQSPNKKLKTNNI